MRILANENVSAEVVEGLRSLGHDVSWLRTEAPGTIDQSVLARAQQEQRILLTFDKDFGELAYRSKLPAFSGVILCRITARSPEHVSNVVFKAVSSRQDWVGHFSVIENTRIRMKPLSHQEHPERTQDEQVSKQTH